MPFGRSLHRLLFGSTHVDAMWRTGGQFEWWTTDAFGREPAAVAGLDTSSVCHGVECVRTLRTDTDDAR